MKSARRAGVRSSEPEMELNVGSNVFRNTNGVLKLDNKEQVVLQIQEEEHQLFLTMDLYDSGGNHIAHLRRNAWGFNMKNRFALEKIPISASLFTYPLCLRVIDQETSEVVLEAKLIEKGIVHISQGKLYSHKGHLLEVTPHCWRVSGKPSMFGSVQDVRGGAALIG
jgi:hypothetical protein